MGKKSRRNKKNNGGPLRKGLAAVPTAAAATNIFKTVHRLLDANNYDKILKIESKYRHIETFSFDPVEDTVVLFAFGRANYECLEDETRLGRAIRYYERAKECMVSNADDQYQAQISRMKTSIGMNLPWLYSDGRDMEKAISSHRWFLENCNRDEAVMTVYLNRLSHNFNRFKKFEYTIELLEGSMDMLETLEEEGKMEPFLNLIEAYMNIGEFLKAKAADEKRRSSTNMNNWVAEMQSGQIEEGMCNYEAAIPHFRKVAAVLQMQEYDGLSGMRVSNFIGLATSLLKHNTDNEAEAFAILQEEVDHRLTIRRDREWILFRMGIEYRNLNKWDQSIENLHQLSQANEAMAQTYLEQYCTDTTLDIDQQNEILRHATDHSILCHVADEVSTEMHLIHAQLSYFDGNKQQAYHHLELYLDARLAECKLSCYTCKQRVRHGSVPFSCASCRVASYCDRQHQKLTWKNERICHKVLCPLFGYWRMAKKKQKKHEGQTNEDRREDRSEYERVFETFFESICPHVKTSTPSYIDGLIFVD